MSSSPTPPPQPDTPGQPSDAPRATRPLPRWTRRKKWLRYVVIPLVVLVAAAIVLTHSPLTRVLVLPKLARALRMDVTADSVSIDWSGRLVLRNAHFRAPGVPGPAGQFLRVDRATADIDWRAIISGSGSPARSVELDTPVVVISQSTDDRRLNIASLAQARGPGASTGSTAMPELPRISLINAAIELGEHAGGTYTPLKRLTMNGSVGPGSAPGSYVASLRQVDPASPTRARALDTAMRVDAAFDPGRISATVTNFNLAEWPSHTLPLSAREVLQDLELAGDVPSASVTYTDEHGVEAELRLKGVAMNLPVAPDPTFTASGVPLEGPPQRLMRMRGVDGAISFAHDTVRARVQGLIEDLPYEVAFRYEGTTADAPFSLVFRSENFRVDRNPSLLPYAPPVVRTWLGTFSSPTALLTANVEVTRGSPGVNGPAALRVAGTIDLKQGTAAYARFPYAFNDMAGRFRFDNDSLEVQGMSGRSPSGATIEANARIAPLDDSAEVRVDVKVRGAPIDAAMEEAFAKVRSNFIQSLFSARAYHELVASGFVRTPADAASEREELTRLQQAPPDDRSRERLAQLRARDAIPVFEMGGAADVDIHIYSPPGINVPWHTTIDVRIPRAGLVPERFPFPIVAKDIVAQVYDESGRLVSGDFRGLSGGSAEVDATFEIPSSKPDAPPPKTQIVIRAQDLPFDALAIHALPVPDANPDGSGTDVRRLLRDLNIEAACSGSLRIANRENEAGRPLGFDADLAFSGARLAPRAYAKDPAVLGEGIGGRVLASEYEVRVELAGRVRAAAQPEGTGSDLAASLEYHADTDTQHRPSRFTARMPALDLSLPMQSLVWVFSARAGDALHDLWERYQPGGRAALDLIATLPGAGASLQVVAEARPAGASTLRLAGQTVELGFDQDSSASLVRVLQGERSSVEFVDFRVPLRVRGDSGGTLSIAGSYPLGRPGPGDRESELRVGMTDCPVESPLVTQALGEALSPKALDSLMSKHPRGRFDADLRIVAEAPDPLKPIPDRVAPRISGAIRPRSLALEMDDVRIEFPTMEGAIEFEPGAGIVRRLTASAPEWTMTLDGSWSSTSEGQLSVRGALSGSAQRLAPDLLAALPTDVREIAKQLDLRVEGPLSLDDTTLTIIRGGDPTQERTEIEGAVRFQDGAMNAGLAFGEMRGRADFTVRGTGGARPSFAVGLAADSMLVSGARIAPARAAIEGLPDGSVVVRDIEGSVHSGRLVGRIELTPPLPDVGSRSYEADLRLAGVRFKPLLDDLDTKKSEAPALSPQRAQELELSRGVLEASVSLTGRTGAGGERRGRGEFRIARRGSRVLDIPLFLRLVEISNLALPLGEGIDLVRSTFYIDGATVAFETLDAYSPSITLTGYGTMTLPGRELDLRFRSQSARPIPVLSWLVQGIRDTLVSAAVRGTLDKPEASLVNLPGPRRAIERTVGAPASDQSVQMDDLQKRAQSLREEQRRPRSRIAPRAAGEGDDQPKADPIPQNP